MLAFRALALALHARAFVCARASWVLAVRLRLRVLGCHATLQGCTTTGYYGISRAAPPRNGVAEKTPSTPFPREEMAWTAMAAIHIVDRIQGHPVYKNPHFRPKSLGVMCGPPHFGELRVLTRGTRFTFLGAPRVVSYKIFLGSCTQDRKFFKKLGFFL